MAGFGVRRRKTVGVDVGAACCKVAIVEHGAGSPRLVQVAVAASEATPRSGAGEGDASRVAEALSAMFKRARIESRDVVIGIGGREVISKVIEIDRMDEAEARAVIPWEAEQHVPFDMENVELDFTVIDPEGGGPVMTVLLAAAQRTLIEERVSLFRQAGLNPVTVDVEALALINALEANYPSAMKDVTALIDIGSGSTTVHLIQDGLPVLTRELAVGAPAPEELTERVGRIARGLQRAGALIATGTNRGIARVYLCGGGAGIAGLAEALAEKLGMETRCASAFQRLDVAPDVADRPDIAALAPMLMLAIGLALRSPVDRHEAPGERAKP